MTRIKPSRALALAVVAFVAGTIGPEVASGSPGPSASAYHAVNPTRVVDTRAGLGGSTMGSGSVLTVALAGVAGGVSAEATAVALNVTVANGTTTSFLTVWPTGANQPDASSLNWTDGAPRANSVTSKLGSDGAISLFNERGAVDVIIDVVGYYETTYVEPAASSGPSLVDANGTDLGMLIGMNGSSYTTLGDDSYVYSFSLQTGKLITNLAFEVYLTGNCTGPSKWIPASGLITPQMLVHTYQNSGVGAVLYVPGAIDANYDVGSLRDQNGNGCYADGNPPTTAMDLVLHGVVPANHPTPLSIQR